MNAINQQPLRDSIHYGPAFGANEELDMIELVAALLKAKWWILLAAVMGGAIAYAITQVMPEQYEAFVRTNLVQHEDPGGVSPDNRRAPEVLTLVEHGFVLGTTSDNFRDVMMVKMRSRQFTMDFVNRYELAPFLFPVKWDAAEQQWIGNKPDDREIYKLFH